MFTTLIIAAIVGCLVIAAIVMPPRAGSVSDGQLRAGSVSDGPVHVPHTIARQASLRQQQLAEEADILTEEFIQRENDRWRCEVRRRAAALLDDGPDDDEVEDE